MSMSKTKTDNKTDLYKGASHMRGGGVILLGSQKWRGVSRI